MFINHFLILSDLNSLLIFFLCAAPLQKNWKRVLKEKETEQLQGLNALTYVPYKKCNALMKFVQKLGIKKLEIKRHSR